jgi:cbb3-type cytochrome oxidase subunit 3
MRTFEAVGLLAQQITPPKVTPPKGPVINESLLLTIIVLYVGAVMFSAFRALRKAPMAAGRELLTYIMLVWVGFAIATTTDAKNVGEGFIQAWVTAVFTVLWTFIRVITPIE